MKNALIIALALASTVSFATDKVSKEATKEAKTACKAEGKKGKEFKACVKEKTATPAATTTK
jgi:hypothetical protein